MVNKDEARDDRLARDIKNAAGKMKISEATKNWLMFFGVLIVIFAISYAIFSNLGKIEYQGLTFHKEKVSEELEIYTYKYSYFSKTRGEVITNNFYVRINPRENDVPIAAEIEYPAEGRNISVSYDSDNLKHCNLSGIAAAGLGQFLANNQYKVLAGEYNAAAATRTGTPYVRCEINRNVMTIEIFAADETRIIKDTENCYHIKVANCEVLKAIEKFELQSLVDAKLRSDKN